MRSSYLKIVAPRDFDRLLVEQYIAGVIAFLKLRRHLVTTEQYQNTLFDTNLDGVESAWSSLLTQKRWADGRLCKLRREAKAFQADEDTELGWKVFTLGIRQVCLPIRPHHSFPHRYSQLSGDLRSIKILFNGVTLFGSGTRVITMNLQISQYFENAEYRSLRGTGSRAIG